MSLRAVRRGTVQDPPAARRASETRGWGAAHVQARRQSDFGGRRGQVRDQIPFQRRPRVGYLFVAVFAGLVSVRGVQGSSDQPCWRSSLENTMAQISRGQTILGYSQPPATLSA